MKRKIFKITHGWNHGISWLQRSEMSTCAPPSILMKIRIGPGWPGDLSKVAQPVSVRVCEIHPHSLTSCNKDCSNLRSHQSKFHKSQIPFDKSKNMTQG